VTQRDFKYNYMARTADAAPCTLPNVPRPNFVSRLKRVIYAFGLYPTQDLEAWEPDLPAQLQHTASLTENATPRQ